MYDAEVHSYETYLQLMKRFDLTIKSFDFAHSIGLPQFAISTDAAQLAGRIRDTAAHALANKMPIVTRIGSHRQSVTASLEKPFLEQLF
ncbi:Uncharacterised protein [Paenibacillus thiaminolyticus]|nr:Uncharacterised protein [Paenibacillus thiaminolyticus]